LVKNGANRSACRAITQFEKHIRLAKSSTFVKSPTWLSHGFAKSDRTNSVVSPSGTTTIAYDFESRITSVTGPGVTASYSYNGLDTRVSKIENGTSQTFERDGAGVTAPVLRDSSASYTPGISERRRAVTKLNHSGLKNADAQSSTAQAVTATRTYDAFGNVASTTGTFSGPFGYAGGFGYQEDATGLKLLGHRYYDSSTGRFLTRDSFQYGKNWYVYCDNSPLCYHDSVGLAKHHNGIVRNWSKVPIMVLGEYGTPGKHRASVIYPGEASNLDQDVDIVITRGGGFKQISGIYVEVVYRDGDDFEQTGGFGWIHDPNTDFRENVGKILFEQIQRPQRDIVPGIPDPKGDPGPRFPRFPGNPSIDPYEKGTFHGPDIVKHGNQYFAE
jgi:RHS repeat-associated protein